MNTYRLFINPDVGDSFEKSGMAMQEILTECKRHSLMFNLSSIYLLQLEQWEKTAQPGEEWLAWYEGMPEVTIWKE